MNTYNPTRIKAAIEYLGWPQSELAQRIGVTDAYVSMLLQEHAPLTDKIVARISFETGFPDTFFMMNNDPVKGALTFRKKGKPRASNQYVSEYNLLNQTVERLWQMIPMSDANDWLDGLAPQGAITALRIERIAEEVRASWGVDDFTPIYNLARQLDMRHVVIASMNHMMANSDGVSSPDPHNKHSIIAVNMQGKTGDRLRFTLAHELGHLILHRYRTSEDVEREANLFAGALLIPENAARHALSPSMSLLDYAKVKANWGVSIAALIERARQLNVITMSRYKSLRIQLSNRRWLQREPVEVPVEEPLLLQQLVAQAFGYIPDATRPMASRQSVEGFLGLPFEMVNHWCWNALFERGGNDVDGLEELLFA